VELVKSYKKSSIWLVILNFIFLFFFFINFVGIHAGGTDDISEGTWGNIYYLLLKGLIALVISLVALVLGLKNKKIKVATLFWLTFSIILIISCLVVKSIPGDTINSNGITTPIILKTNISILMIIIDSIVTLLFSIVLSVLTLIQKDTFGAISLFLNTVVLLLYICIFFAINDEIFFLETLIMIGY
jgi:hypothetical protein